MNFIEKNIQSNLKTLDFGCGQDKIENSIGIDKIKSKTVDILHNLDQYPYPFEDNFFDLVVCKHSISHIKDLEQTMLEIFRILKPGGRLLIIAPHFSSDNTFTDYTIKHFFGYRTLDYFMDNNSGLSEKYSFYSKIKFSILKRRVFMFKSIRNNLGDYILSTLFLPLDIIINIFPRFYEKFLCFILRANEITFLLEKK
jgi:SAM-dependent methyltransferase